MGPGVVAADDFEGRAAGAGIGVGDAEKAARFDGREVRSPASRLVSDNWERRRVEVGRGVLADVSAVVLVKADPRFTWSGRPTLMRCRLSACSTNHGRQGRLPLRGGSPGTVRPTFRMRAGAPALPLPRLRGDCFEGAA